VTRSAESADVPHPPWRLQGHALAILRWLPIRDAQRLLPHGMHAVPLRPGRTLSVVLCAHYGAGSTVAYDELIVSPGLVRRGWRIGAWISGIWVNDRISLAGGRSIWGLPKALASFEWSADARRARVLSHDGEMSCDLNALDEGSERRGWPLPFAVPVWGRRQRLLTFLVRGVARVHSSRGRSSLQDRDAGLHFEDERATVFTLGRLALRIGEPARAG
jgi:acetoacetate decarboxylase